MNPPVAILEARVTAHWLQRLLQQQNVFQNLEVVALPQETKDPRYLATRKTPMRI